LDNWVNVADPVPKFAFNGGHVGIILPIGTGQASIALPVSNALGNGGFGSVMGEVADAAKNIYFHYLDTYGETLKITPLHITHSLLSDVSNPLESLLTFGGASTSNIEVIDGTTVKNGSLTVHLDTNTDTATLTQSDPLDLILVGGDKANYTATQNDATVVALGDNTTLTANGTDDTLVAGGGSNVLQGNTGSKDGTNVLIGNVGLVAAIDQAEGNSTQADAPGQDTIIAGSGDNIMIGGKDASTTFKVDVSNNPNAVDVIWATAAAIPLIFPARAGSPSSRSRTPTPRYQPSRISMKALYRMS
jgi:hypothetical protein